MMSRHAMVLTVISLLTMIGLSQGAVSAQETIVVGASVALTGEYARTGQEQLMQPFRICSLVPLIAEEAP